MAHIPSGTTAQIDVLTFREALASAASISPEMHSTFPSRDQETASAVSAPAAKGSPSSSAAQSRTQSAFFIIQTPLSFSIY